MTRNWARLVSASFRLCAARRLPARVQNTRCRPCCAASSSVHCGGGARLLLHSALLLVATNLSVIPGNCCTMASISCWHRVCLRSLALCCAPICRHNANCLSIRLCGCFISVHHPPIVHRLDRKSVVLGKE